LDPPVGLFLTSFSCLAKKPPLEETPGSMACVTLGY